MSREVDVSDRYPTAAQVAAQVRGQISGGIAGSTVRQKVAHEFMAQLNQTAARATGLAERAEQQLGWVCSDVPPLPANKAIERGKDNWPEMFAGYRGHLECIQQQLCRIEDMLDRLEV